MVDSAMTAAGARECSELEEDEWLEYECAQCDWNGIIPFEGHVQRWGRCWVGCDGDLLCCEMVFCDWEKLGMGKQENVMRTLF